MPFLHSTIALMRLAQTQINHARHRQLRPKLRELQSFDAASFLHFILFGCPIARLKRRMCGKQNLSKNTLASRP